MTRLQTILADAAVFVLAVTFCTFVAWLSGFEVGTTSFGGMVMLGGSIGWITIVYRALWRQP